MNEYDHDWIAYRCEVPGCELPAFKPKTPDGDIICATHWKELADDIARAERERVLAEVEALANELKARRSGWPSHPHWEAWNATEQDLRNLVAHHRRGEDK